MTVSTSLDTGVIVEAGSVAVAMDGVSCKVPFASPLVARSLSRGRSEDMVRVCMHE